MRTKMSAALVMVDSWEVPCPSTEDPMSASLPESAADYAWGFALNPAPSSAARKVTADSAIRTLRRFAAERDNASVEEIVASKTTCEAWYAAQLSDESDVESTGPVTLRSAKGVL